MKYTLPLQDELFTVKMILDINGECHFKSRKEEVEQLIKAVVGSMLRVSKLNLSHTKFNKHIKPYWRYNKDTLNETHAMKEQAFYKWGDQGKRRESNNILFIEYNTAKKEFRREQRVAQYAYEYDMMKEIESEKIIDNHFLWYIFRKSMRQIDQKVIAPVRNEQGKLITDTEGIVNEWMLHNKKLLNIPENVEEYSEFYEYIASTVEELHRN